MPRINHKNLKNIKNSVNHFTHQFLPLALCLLCCCLISCTKNEQSSNQNDGKINVITTIFPSYDWLKNIAGDKINLELLITDGSDLHNYQPTIKDIVRINKCDLFVYVGGNSDLWVNDVLKQSKNKNIKAVNLLDNLGNLLKTEEIVEGMQEHAHDESEHEHDNHEHSTIEELEYDEHIWLSLNNAKILCNILCDVLCEVDSKDTVTFKQNLNSYLIQLEKLNEEYKNVTENAKINTILVADRFPFRYLVDDYKINYYAAFAGCSAETEASFNTIKTLSNKLDELNLTSVFVLENSDKKLAKTIIENSKSQNQQILELNSIQTVTMDDIKKGTTYIQIMQKNLIELKNGMMR